MPGRETLLVPGLPLGMGIALGAIISPTDAVATAIVRRAGIPPRIVPGVDGDDFQAGAARETVARFRALRLEVIAAQREELLAIRDLGTHPSAMLDSSLAQLDTEQLGIELLHHE